MADRSRQAMVGCTWVSVGSLGAAVVVSSPAASLACYAAMVVSAITVVVIHLASARAYDPYRETEKES